MRILSMTATFGKLEHRTLTLKPGLNVIDAPNEWGKSTWCAFVLAMLYGLDTRARTTGRALAEKEKYRPWSGSPMEGRMDLVWQDRNITLQRRTTGRVPLGDFRAYETDTGLPVPELTAENCALVLLGVERSVYQRTGFIRLEELPVAQDEALRRRLNALVTTGDESQAGDLLETKLRDLKNRCRHNHTGLIPQAERELAACTEKQAQIAQLCRRQAQLEQQFSDCEAQTEALEARCQAQALREAAQQQAHRQEETLTASSFRLWLGLGILAAAAMILLFILRPRVWPAIGLGMLLLTLGASLALHGKSAQKPAADQNQSPPPADDLPDGDTQAKILLTQARQRQQQLQLALGQCQGQLQALGEANLDARIAALEQRLGKLRQTEAALDLALKTLDTARQALQRRFSPKLSQLALTLFSQLTGNRYEALALDESLSLTIRARGETTMSTPLWHSSGTTDQLYLALRLAAAQTLIPAAPLVLDDALARFDPDRRENAMAVLRQCGENTQVILFTSGAHAGP